MIVYDASVLIAHLNPRDTHHETADRLLDALGAHEWGMGPVTLAEVLVGPSAAGTADVVERQLDDLQVSTIPFPSDAGRRLADLRAQTGLRLPDCCVLLAVEQTGGELATFDERLTAAAHARGVTVHA